MIVNEETSSAQKKNGPLYGGTAQLIFVDEDEDNVV